MIDRSAVERVLTANRYLVLGTADETGNPWVSPVFYASLDSDHVVWVSSPDSRHSRNIASRAAVAITVFDSTGAGWVQVVPAMTQAVRRSNSRTSSPSANPADRGSRPTTTASSTCGPSERTRSGSVSVCRARAGR